MTCFIIALKIHPGIYAMKKSILCLLGFSDFEIVDAQPMNLRLLESSLLCWELAGLLYR